MGLGGGRKLDRAGAVFATLAALLAFAALALLFAPARSGIEQARAAAPVAGATPPSERLDLLARPEPKRPPRAEADEDRGLGQVRNAAGEPLEVSGACEDNLELAAKHGLTLPAGWDMRCVGPALDWDGNSHWGVTCPYDSCPEPGDHYVSISNPTYYVIAHELCHANYGNDELMADSCAAEHGASLATSPYQ